MKIRELTKISICIALLCVSSYISFPVPFSPVMVTAQTIVINIIALILTPKDGFIAVTGYILLGIFGLPVFAGGDAGIGKVLGPTGGFIIGFLIAAPIMSYFKGKSNNFKRYLLVTMLIGMPIIYIFGCVYMSIIQHISILSAITIAVLPFIVGDILKSIAGSFISVKLNNRLFNN